MGRIENRQNYARIKASDADNYIKCKGLNTPIKGRDFDTG